MEEKEQKGKKCCYCGNFEGYYTKGLRRYDSKTASLRIKKRLRFMGVVRKRVVSYCALFLCKNIFSRRNNIEITAIHSNFHRRETEYRGIIRKRSKNLLYDAFGANTRTLPSATATRRNAAYTVLKERLCHTEKQKYIQTAVTT